MFNNMMDIDDNNIQANANVSAGKGMTGSETQENLLHKRLNKEVSKKNGSGDMVEGVSKRRQVEKKNQTSNPSEQLKNQNNSDIQSSATGKNVYDASYNNYNNYYSQYPTYSYYPMNYWQQQQQQPQPSQQTGYAVAGGVSGVSETNAAQEGVDNTQHPNQQESLTNGKILQKRKTRWDVPLDMITVQTFIAQYAPYTAAATSALSYRSGSSISLNAGNTTKPNEIIQNIANAPMMTVAELTAKSGGLTGGSGTWGPMEELESRLAITGPEDNSFAWPDKLKNFIQRSFDKCLNDNERVYMNYALRRVLGSAKKNQQILSRDWNGYPLPLLPREGGPTYKTSYVGGTPSDTSSFMLKNTGLLSEHDEQQQHMQFQTPFVMQFPQPSTTNVPKIGPVNAGASIWSKLKKPGAAGNGQAMNMETAKKLLSAGEPMLTPEELEKRKQRLGRFSKELSANIYTSAPKDESFQLAGISAAGDKNSEGIDYEELAQKMTIKGTLQTLEKRYLRLTRAPLPSEVRPESILKKTLVMLKKKWKNQEVEYPYINEQFRSMRQDLTVQRIKNQFTVEVYETHARIALECQDMDQFNQCQTQLHDLFHAGLNGHKMEFFAYRLLYLTHQNMKTELSKLLKQVTPEHRANSFVKHALKVKEAFMNGNYVKYFRLIKEAPNLGSYLMEFFIKKTRIEALQMIAKTYRGMNIDIKYVTKILAFNNPESLVEFVTSTGGKISQDGKVLLCKESLNGFMTSEFLRPAYKVH